MPFNLFDKNFSWPRWEEEILVFWDREDIFRKSLTAAKDRPRFVFYEGPPTANGRPGIHHVIARAVKDFVCRYKAMRGYLVERKGGWDTHGLPVEIEVEKQLGLKNKQAVLKYGVAEFNQACRDSVFKYLEDWNKITRRTAFWLDLENPYVTLHASYIESLWWILADFFNRGLVYRGYKTIPFCPRCETGLSSHEVAQGYEDVADPSVFVRMRARDGDYSFLVWTTTPWTLPSNVALAVNADADYVLVQWNDEKLLLAEALATKALAAGEWTVISRHKGKDLFGRAYIPLFDFYSDSPAPAFTVVTGDFVTLENGTGIVHIAPGFGADDYDIGQRYDLPTVQAIEPNGVFKALAGKYAGMWIKDADVEIVKDLKIAGKLFKKEIYKHSYPFCWRCHSPLIYIARQSWYIRTSQFREQLLRNSNAIRWKPDEIRTGRMQNWLENNVDWAISRERFWGSPLPFWVCQNDKCGRTRAISSIDQMYAEAKDAPPRAQFDPHKPVVDEVILTCSCGSDMRRVAEVVDVWFDSGAMPFAQWGYPFKNKELLEREWFPADFVSEGVDQTRGWFYSLIAISTLLKEAHPELGPEPGGQPFRSVIVNEFILDKAGKKMSKHKGNVVDPFAMCDKYGADPLRWYLLTVSNPWAPTRFDEDGLVEVLRKFFDTLKNCYNFFGLYANADTLRERVEAANENFRDYLAANAGPSDRLDRWITSRFHSLVADVTIDFEDFEITRGLRKIGDFTIDDLSNWYVRRNRKRFWRSGDDSDKLRAYVTLYDMLLGVARLIAPATPMVADMLYRGLTDTTMLSDTPSIHLCAYPQSDPSLIDERLERDMALAQKIVSLGRAARTRANLKVRQPLARVLVALPAETTFDALAEDFDEIMDELNLKSVAPLTNPQTYQIYSAKLNFAVAGKKFGPLVKDLGAAVSAIDSTTLQRAERNFALTVTINGQAVSLERDDVLINKTDEPGFAIESDGGVMVALDTALTAALLSEGFARESVNRIQNMRKQANFAITDRIVVYVRAAETLRHAIAANADLIKRETLANDIIFTDTEPAELGVFSLSQEHDINGEQTTLAVVRQ